MKNNCSMQMPPRQSCRHSPVNPAVSKENMKNVYANPTRVNAVPSPCAPSMSAYTGRVNTRTTPCVQSY